VRGVDVGGAEHPESVERGVDPPSGAEGLSNRAALQDGNLLEVADLDAPAAAHFTRIRLKFAGDYLQESRLSRPVDAHHSDPVTRGDREEEVLQDGSFGPLKGDVLEIDEYCHEIIILAAKGSRPSGAGAVKG
jgi:hypothetical protein